jgi:hypothetical protein
MTAAPGPDDAVTFGEYTGPVPYVPVPRADNLAEARTCLETARTARSEVVGQYLARATAHATIAVADALTALAARPPALTAELVEFAEVGEITDEDLFAAASTLSADLLEMDAAEDIRLDKWPAADDLVKLVHPNALRFARVDEPDDREPAPARRPYVYVASSWRNPVQPAIVAAIREVGFDVYDFRNPPNGAGFGWEEIHPDWQQWTAAEYQAALEHPRAVEGFASDFDAMQAADIVVLVLPCGRSAHLELGWAVGAGKRTAILLNGDHEPELMVKMVDHIAVDVPNLLAWMRVQP